MRFRKSFILNVKHTIIVYMKSYFTTPIDLYFNYLFCNEKFIIMLLFIELCAQIYRYVDKVNH